MATASIFMNGGSQAVRIPRPFRFTTDRVSVQAFHGGVLLMPISSRPKLEDVFAKCDALSDGEKGFLSKRPCNEPAQDRKLFA